MSLQSLLAYLKEHRLQVINGLFITSIFLVASLFLIVFLHISDDADPLVDDNNRRDYDHHAAHHSGASDASESGSSVLGSEIG